MQFVTFYTLTGDRTKENVAELMALFAERGAVKGTIQHYVYADGGGGFVIVDETALEQIYENSLAYGQWMEFTIQPIITIDEAVPQIGGFLSS